jgi:hypothetical protein
VPDNMAGSWFELVERRGAEPEPEPAAEPAAEPTPRRIKRIDL